MQPLVTIADVPIWNNGDGSLSWLSGMQIDADGSGRPLGDVYYQPDTSLHYNGVALNAELEKFGVVPPQIIRGVPGIVLGCKGQATNILNGNTASFVVADRGPESKIGEGSVALAEMLGVPPSPVSGGIYDHVIAWQIWPGVPAECNGRAYQLQASV